MPMATACEINIEDYNLSKTTTYQVQIRRHDEYGKNGEREKHPDTFTHHLGNVFSGQFPCPHLRQLTFQHLLM